MIGQVIGNYRVVSELGKGGMGVVYVAEHVQLGRPAALKMLLPQFSSDEGIVQRFFNEARAASAIQHPGIVEIYDYGKHTDGRAFLVMALLAGESLQERMARAPLGFAEGATIVAQVASALAAAHARGIVHRDLKPDNIYLVPNELMPFGTQVKLLDFGIAKLADERASFKTQTGSLIGTPAYMSPEQCMGRSDVDHRTDLYALGCILCHVLAGRPPFVSDAGAGPLIAAHLRDPAPDPRTFDPRIPEELARITLRLLAKDPAARYQSALELRDALTRAGANVSTTMSATEPTTGRYHGPEAFHPTTTSGSAAQVIAATPVRRRAGMWIALALLGVVGGVVTFVALSGEREQAAVVVVAPPIDAEAPAPRACSIGQIRSDDTQGHCCWPEQAWSSAKQRCVGVPRCPKGMTPARDEACVERVAEVAPGSTVPTFVLDKQAYAPGERVTLKFAEPVPSAGAHRAWVTIVAPALRAEAYGTWEFVPDKARSVSMQAPQAPGTYEARVHTDYSTKMTNLRYRVTFTVRALAEAELVEVTPPAKQRFTLVEPAVDRGAWIELAFAAPMYAEKGEKFWITVVSPNAPDSRYGTYIYVTPGAKTAKIAAPSTAGTHEVRLHANYPRLTTNVVDRVSVDVR